jgi:exopolyphosphatase / guanosine-5'-triphosphate,3'-diphosphate pyrophosphatase
LPTDVFQPIEDLRVPTRESAFRQIAAIDLGSNSFHMVVARLDRGEIRVQERRSEKVQLGAGMDAHDNLTDDVQKRALECLKRYAQRIAGFPPGAVRVVGTNALRVANNSEKFIARAQKVLGHPIDIVAGREEARLIYLGVSHTLADDKGRRLVIDIGGGSTEFIVGERFEPLVMESLHMGCVAFAMKYFPRDIISEKAFDAAVTAAHQELLPVRKIFKKSGWKSAVGSSGSIKAVQAVLAANGLGEDCITQDGLYQLRRRVLKARHAGELNLAGLETQRQGIFVPGLAILTAAFEALEIGEMRYSIGALREGALYDLIGRRKHEDVRDRSVQALMARNHVDEGQAKRVAATALKLFDQARRHWDLNDEDRDLLRRAALAHEIGQDISHSNYHKHGAYLLQHSDMAGFSRQEQKVMATLVRNQRRKITMEHFSELRPALRQRALRLSLLLRLAVILHHGRSERRLPTLQFKVEDIGMTLKVPAGWVQARTLALADLEQEAAYLAIVGYSLHIKFARKS